MDFQASIHNLLQLDRHQETAHRTPLEHQAATEHAQEQETAHRTEMPNQPEQTEGKNVDSEGSKRYMKENEKRRKKKKKRTPRGRTIDGAGRFVDVTV